MKDNDWIERQRKAGYVRRKVFANLCGRGDGGNITELAQKYGVDVIFKKMGGKTGGRPMKRNPAANCGNCPYWKRTAMGWWDDGLLFGWCRYWPSKIKKRDTEWCGQHPDFWETDK